MTFTATDISFIPEEMQWKNVANYLLQINIFQLKIAVNLNEIKNHAHFLHLYVISWNM